MTYNKGSWDLWYVCRRTLRVCWEIFWLILLKITQFWLLVAGKYFTPCRVSAQQFQCFRLRVMPYIHPSWPPTERSSLSHSAFALLNSKGFFFIIITVISCQESKEKYSWLTCQYFSISQGHYSNSGILIENPCNSALQIQGAHTSFI